MYLAVDGGGTKTHYVLVSNSFEPIDQYTGGSTNYERLDGNPKSLLPEISDSTQVLLSRNHLHVSDIISVVAGMSGADSQKQADAIGEVFQRAGFHNVRIFNDGFLPVMANCSSMSGINLNCGTGVCCAAIDLEGKTKKVGGLDEWSSDAGGGYWLLQKVFTSIYNEVVLHKSPTIMTLLCTPGMNSDQLCEYLNDLKSDRELQKQWVQHFFSAYDSGDASAVEIANEIITRCTDYIAAVSTDMNFAEEVPIILEGSVLKKAATLRFLQELKSHVESSISKKIIWLKPESDPVYGAVNWIRASYSSMNVSR